MISYAVAEKKKKGYFTISDLATKAKVHRGTVRYAIKTGKIKAKLVGHTHMIDQRNAAKFITLHSKTRNA